MGDEQEVLQTGQLTVSGAIDRIEWGFAPREIEEDEWAEVGAISGFDMFAFSNDMVALYGQLVWEGPDGVPEKAQDIAELVAYTRAEEDSRALRRNLLGLPDLRVVPERDIPYVLAGEESQQYREWIRYVVTEGRDGDMRRLTPADFLDMFRYVYACGLYGRDLIMEDGGDEVIGLIALLRGYGGELDDYYTTHNPEVIVNERDNLMFTYYLLLQDMGIRHMDLDYAIHETNYLRTMLLVGLRLGLLEAEKKRATEQSEED